MNYCWREYHSCSVIAEDSLHLIFSSNAMIGICIRIYYLSLIFFLGTFVLKLVMILLTSLHPPHDTKLLQQYYAARSNKIAHYN